MNICIDASAQLLVQGITGRDGSFHGKQMMAYGTKVVAGVTPGKGGQRFEDAVPVFNTVAEAGHQTQAETPGIYLPAPAAAPAHFRGGGFKNARGGAAGGKEVEPVFARRRWSAPADPVRN